MFEFTESPGEKNKKSEKWNFLIILHVKHTEGSLTALTEFDPEIWSWNSESTAKNMPSIAFNLKIWAYSKARSILIKTMVELTESTGEKYKVRKMKFFDNFACQTYWRIADGTYLIRSKCKDFRHFFEFLPTEKLG